MTAEKKQTIDRTNQFNRLMYAGFVLIAVYFLAVRGDMGTAMSNLGIALIFDRSSRDVGTKAFLSAYVVAGPCGVGVRAAGVRIEMNLIFQAFR